MTLYRVCNADGALIMTAPLYTLTLLWNIKGADLEAATVALDDKYNFYTYVFGQCYAQRMPLEIENPLLRRQAS